MGWFDDEDDRQSRRQVKEVLLAVRKLDERLVRFMATAKESAQVVSDKLDAMAASVEGIKTDYAALTAKIDELTAIIGNGDTPSAEFMEDLAARASKVADDLAGVDASIPVP